MNSLTLQSLRERKDPELRLLVIGDPIDHSLSPPMHNAALEFLHLPCVYGRLRVGPKNLREAFKILREQDFIGWNLTLPHKLVAIDLLDGLDPMSERLALGGKRGQRAMLSDYSGRARWIATCRPHRARVPDTQRRPDRSDDQRGFRQRP